MTLLFGSEAGTLGQPVRDHLGEHLRSLYQETVNSHLPKDLAGLVRRLERVIQARTEAPDPVFMAKLMKAVPNLRTFAISLVRDVERAEDLVQETMLKAWDKQATFQAGTNFEAWLFTILRNQRYSDFRKYHREVEDPEGAYAAEQIVLPEQIVRLEMQDLSSALAKLHPDQREALLLVGAQGLSYEDAAAVLGVPDGTVKSRVNRARNRLAELLGLEGDDAGASRMSQ